MDNYREFAIQLALRAGAIMKQNFALGMEKEWKADGTPITLTDKAINQLVLDAVREAYPSHSVLAEEGSDVDQNEYVWVCDPIDGTAPFSRGYPTFVFSLALTKNGQSILGIMHDPMSNRLVRAEKGAGAYLNNIKISVSSSPAITEKSFIHIDCDHRLLSLRSFLLTKYGCYVPHFYSGVYASMLVSAGEFLAEIFEYENPWDAAAVKIIVEEAGGKVTDIFGGEQRYDQSINGFVASNGKVHEQLLIAIQQCLRENARSR